MSSNMIQSSFQFGEVSELLHARVDSPIYYRAVKRLRNMLVIPQGGAERRFGQVAVDQVNDHAGSPVYVTNYRYVKPYIFDYEDGSRYLLIFRGAAGAGAVDVYFNNVYQSTLVTAYLDVEIEALSITQSANIIFVASQFHAPATIVRSGTAPITLTLATPAFLEYPTFDFKQTYDTFTFQVKVGGVLIVTAQNLLGQVVTITSSAALFDTNYVGGLFFGEGGVIRITGYTSTTVVTGRITNTFDTESSLFHAGAGNAITGSDAVVTEIAFSATRGWPQKVAFFQNRIFFGRTSLLPGGIWGSNYNGYSASKLHFDDSEVLDTNAISTIVQGTKSTLIQHMVAFKTLLVFTTSGLYSTPLLIDLPLTPTNISFLNLQTSDAASNVVPLVFDNDVIFFDKGGKKVKSVNVYATTQHYESKVISVLAPHLIDNPYSAGVFENSSLKDGNWMFMVNNRGSRDGQLAVYQSVPEQEITAWSLSTTANTLSTTTSKYRHVVSDEEIVFFIVERVVNGNTRLFIEQLSFNAYLDASLIKTQALSTTVTGLSYLEGETVRVRGYNSATMTDYAVMNSATVTGGQITTEFAVTNVEVGLGWSPEIVPMPLNIPMPNGNNLYMPKSINKIYVDYFESLGIEVNGDVLPSFKTNSNDVYGQPPVPKTEFVQIESMTGWDPSAEISISQSDPLPLTLLGIGFVVNS